MKKNKALAIAVALLACASIGAGFADDAKTLLERGVQQEKSGNSKGALESYNQAVKLSPDDITALMGRARMADYDHVIAKNSKIAKAWIYRGECKLRTGDAGGGVKDASEGLKLDPKDNEGYEVRAMAENSLHQFSQAKVDIDTALKLTRDSDTMVRAWILKNRALNKHRLGDTKGAMDDIGVSITLKPEAPAYFMRGMFKSDTGDQKGAGDDWVEAGNRDPEWTKTALGNLPEATKAKIRAGSAAGGKTAGGDTGKNIVVDGPGMHALDEQLKNN